MLALLSPRVWLALVLSAVLAFTHFTVYRAGRNAVRVEWDAEKLVNKEAADAQAARNRDLQRAAEKRYTVKTTVQEQFFDTAAKEVHDASAPLATCPVPEPVRVRLNAAAACARGDSAASCGDADPVPDAR